MEEVVPTSIGIEKIEFIGNEDVYNLEVKVHHNFSINDGLIVHNSVDSARYGLESFERFDIGIKKISSLPKGW